MPPQQLVYVTMGDQIIAGYLQYIDGTLATVRLKVGVVWSGHINNIKQDTPPQEQLQLTI